MSLVAYDASSDEESENENENANMDLNVNGNEIKAENVNTNITDDEDEEHMENGNSAQSNGGTSFDNLSQLLPKQISIEELIFAKLPKPKHTENQPLAEDDDEFLHKKPEPIETPVKPAVLKNKKGPVKITIPSLKDFKDVDENLLKSSSQKKAGPQIEKPKGSGLLNMLPQAKSERNFAKSTTTSISTTTKAPQNAVSIPRGFIPDTVKFRRPAHNTEDVDMVKMKPKTVPADAQQPKITVKKRKADTNHHKSDSDGSDNEEKATDFFSFNPDENLPEISANEINLMVAKRAAQMAEAPGKYLSTITDDIDTKQKAIEMEQSQVVTTQSTGKLDADAIHALVGRKAKRQRKEEIEIVDLSGDQVLPNRNEWIRTALASSTVYQPTGQLVDEEPAAGTRKKHQITYLAHKAKANEAELQAMWATNRATRRATQSKYGF